MELFKLPEPKSLNLEYLYVYILLNNLNYYIQKYKFKKASHLLTAEKMNISDKQVYLSISKYGFQYSLDKKLYYVSIEHPILKLNQIHE